MLEERYHYDDEDELHVKDVDDDKDFHGCQILGISFSILGEMWGRSLCQDKTCL